MTVSRELLTSSLMGAPPAAFTAATGRPADWTVPRHGGVLWSSPKHPQRGIMGWRTVCQLIDHLLPEDRGWGAEAGAPGETQACTLP